MKRSRAVAAALLVLLGAASSALAQAPDLLAFNALGPPQTLLGKNVTVNATLINLGGPFSGTVTFEILLSADNVIDASDIVVATSTESVVGSFTVLAGIPADLTPGPYNFALRIQPVAGEVNLANNQILGSHIEVQDVDLCLVNPSPIVVVSQVDGEDPPPYVVEVANCGTSTGILIFTVIAQSVAPWLTVNPTTSFTVAGGAPQKVTLSFDSQGLPTGTYNTQLIFQNFQSGPDFEILDVTLSVENVVIRPGDLLLGSIDGPDEVDEALFHGLAGMKLKVKVVSETGNIRPHVSVLTEAGDVVQSWTFKHSDKKVGKSTKLPASGLYRIRVEGAGDSIGSYLVHTGWKLPAAARAFQKTVKPVPGTGTAAVTVLGLPGGLLDFTATPKKNFTGTLALSLTKPDLTTLDIAPNSEEIDGGGMLVEGVVFAEAGAYQIGVHGFGADQQKVKLVIEPQIAAGTATVLLP